LTRIDLRMRIPWRGDCFRPGAVQSSLGRGMIGRRTASRACVGAGFAAALALPAVAFFHDRNGLSFLDGVHGRALLQVFFPLVGLYAFTFVTAQVLIATNLYSLTKLWPGTIRYHRAQGIFALLFAVLHPLFILIGFGAATFFSYSGYLRPGVSAGWIVPAIIALAILLLTVSTAVLAWSGRRVAWWRNVHRLNYLVFALVWLHSWFIGTDTQTHLVRAVWVVYLALVIASTTSRYVTARDVARARPAERSLDGD
jgi:DMSO/TMAO reductase YedYZ heme-binding membrane subunit